VQDPPEVGQVGVIDARIEALAKSQHAVFATWQLDSIGVDSRTLVARQRDGRVRRLYRGVYATGPYLTLRGRLMAAVLACGPGALLSHRPAGLLWHLTQWKGGPIDVTCTKGRSRRRSDLRPHNARLRDSDRAVIDDIPVTSVARTLLDLAATVSATELQRAYEQAQHIGVLDIAAITDLLARANGHRGVGPVAALIDYDPTAAAATLSELERLFLDLLRAAGIPMPLTNVLVDGFLVDAHWPEANLVVELDGYEFHHDRAAFERDHAKLGRMRLAGYEVLPLTYRQVTEEPAWVIGAVRSLLARAASNANL
jgi:predicted transcriptional regulator of viral defense system